MNCEFCQSPVHVWFQCPKKPDGWKPARLAKKSGGAESEDGSERVRIPTSRPLRRTKCFKCGHEVAVTKGGKLSRHASARGAYRLPGDANICPASGADAHIDTNDVVSQSAGDRGRDPETVLARVQAASPKFDKKAWMREYMREHRKGIRRRAAK